MLTVYPFGTGSAYTASYSISSSFASSARFIKYVISASTADQVLFPISGSRGKGICLLTTEQYLLLSGSGARVENCDFSD